MDAAIATMEGQLDVWTAKIKTMDAEYLKYGSRVGFNTLIYIDELRVLLAVVRLNLDAYRSAGAPKRADLKPRLKDAWDEFATAMRLRPPPPFPG